MAGFRFTLKLTPHGRLALEESDDAPELAPELARRLQEAFSRGPGFGLLQLGAREVGETVPAVFAYWREFAARFVTALCTRTAADDAAVRNTGSAGRGAGRTVPVSTGNDRGRIHHARRAARALARTGDRVRRGDVRRPSPSPAVSQIPESRLEPRRPGPLQPGREPQGRRSSVCISRHLYDAPVERRPGRSICRSARP